MTPSSGADGPSTPERLAAFVVNSTLAGARFSALCKSKAALAGWQTRIYSTREPNDAADLARAARGDGASLVVAAGGDGTVRGCAQALRSTGVPLGIVPLGTANLFARALGLPRRSEHAVDVALRGTDLAVDLAAADGLPFAAMAGIGLDATVVAATKGKHQLGWLAYAVAGAAHLRLPPTEFTVRLDDAEPARIRARCVVVGNVGLLPGGFMLLPDARLRDGRLDVGILAPHGSLGWARLAGRVLTRSRRAGSELYRAQAGTVEITTAAPLPRQADGELLAPARTLTVTVSPRSLLVRVAVPGDAVRQAGNHGRGRTHPDGGARSP